MMLDILSLHDESDFIVRECGSLTNEMSVENLSPPISSSIIDGECLIIGELMLPS